MDNVNFNSIASSMTEHIPLAVSKITSLAVDILTEYGFSLFLGLYSAYQFYQGYQCRQHNPFHLDNQLKLVKCEMLLQDIEKKRESEDVSHLLEKCENLLASIKPSSSNYDKDRLTFRLALQFATHAPEKFYILASQVGNCPNLIEAAEILVAKHPQFDSTKVANLLQKALNILKRSIDSIFKLKHKPTLEILKLFLKIAKTADKIQNSELAETAYLAALGIIGNFTDTFDDVKGSIEIAKCCREINKIKNETDNLGFARKKLQEVPPLKRFQGHIDLVKYYRTINDQENMNTCLGRAKASLNDDLMKKIDLPKSYKLEKKDELIAHLTLARTFLDFEDAEKMNLELQSEPIIQFLQNKGPLNQDELDILERLMGQMLSDKGEFLPEFIDFKQSLIKRLEVTVLSLTNAERLLTCASAFKSLGNTDKAKEAASLAFNNIQSVKKEKLCSTLLEIIDYYPYKETPEEILPMVKMLKESYREMTFEKDSSEKTEVAARITRLLNAMNSKDKAEDSSAPDFSEQADAFFNNYISDLVKAQKSPFDVVNQLVHLEGDLTEKQRRAALEEAEKWLPKVPSLHKSHKSLVTLIIAQAYLKVDPKKSQELIEKNQNSRAKSHYLLGTISAVAMAAFAIAPVATVYALGVAVMIKGIQMVS